MSPARRAISARSLCGALAILAAACEVVSEDAKQDTTTLPASGAPAPASGAAAGGVPPVPSDSAAAAAQARDTGVVLLHPERPRRGDVLFALARGLAPTQPRCTWKSAPLPCHTVPGGVLAVVPLPADEPPGVYTLVFEKPAGRVARQITVGDRDFGRELVFLDDSLYRLVTQTRDVARDARALRGVLSGETGQRHWSGRWREPVEGAGRSSEYGVERFYYRASDSARAITLAPGLRTRGTFGGDTAGARADVPGWRHAGVDLAARAGARVLAPAAGAVAEVGEYTLTGRTLLLDHGQGVFSAYFHLDTALVREGDLVRAGQLVARVGATGLATGPHLHYGIYVHGRDVDPAAWRAMPAFARGDTSATPAAAAGAR